MINGHLINHYYIIELFNDLMGKNRFPQSFTAHSRTKKGKKKMPLVIFVVVSFLMRFRVGGLGMFYLNDVTSQLWYVGDSRDS